MREDDDATEFDWDGGNAEKNWLRHRVSQSESEQVFFNRPLVVAEDDLHSHEEARYFALGHTDHGRLLAIVYTLRGEKIRVISARDMSRREQKEYENAQAQEFEAGSAV
ncbi:MAG TPA: BrnT family toxin [Rubrobacter sp.]|nr:BrnT family toxin [Rubrobacter sp.]